jgi:hypothetical protein
MIQATTGFLSEVVEARRQVSNILKYCKEKDC